MDAAVLDSFAVLAFLYGEDGHEKVVSALEEALREGSAIPISAPNWAEVRYIVERRSGASRWAEVREKLLALPIEVVPADRDLAEAAGELKASRKLSLADAFAAALARRLDADLFTGDPEFRAVEDVVSIVWLTER